MECPHLPHPLQAGWQRQLSSSFRAGLPIALLALGLCFLFHPTLRTGLDGIPGDLGDARLQNYFLEHTFLWLSGRADHREFWDPPIFHPRKNMAAYSDVLVGAAPFYWPWRALSISPETSFQLWMVVVAALSFLAGFLFLRGGLGLGPLAAGTGAFLFAFGGARAIHLTHAQLLPHFFFPLAVYALIQVFRLSGEARREARLRLAWLLVAALAAVGQIYAGFYLGWFFFLGLTTLVAAALLFRSTRRETLSMARSNWPALLLATAVSVIALSPLLVHYGRAAAELPVRQWEHTLPMIPTVESWVTLGQRSWLYGWMERPQVRALLRRHHPDVPIGMGLVTSACAALGLWQAARDRKWMAAVLVATALLVLVTLRFPGDVTAWRSLWLHLPSASAVRAVFRVGVFMLLPAAIGLAWFLDTRKRRWVAVLLAAVCIAEQGTTMTTYSKREARQRAAWIAQRVGPGCRSFLFIANKQVPEALPALFYHIDAMAAQARRGVPTLNGYSGQFPPGYTLYEIVVRAPEHGPIVRANLAAWIARESLDANQVCVVDEPFPFL